MPSIDRQTVLEKDRWFSGLPAELKNRLIDLPARTYRNRELIHARGEGARGLFGVLSGQAKVCAVARNGKEMLLTMLEPGNWFGITSALDNETHTHDVFAVGEAKILRMAQADFQFMLERDPRHAIYFARWVSLQLRRVFQGVEDTTLLGMEELLAKRILNLVSVDHGPDALPQAQVTVNLSQTDIASLLGTTRQSVSKQLKQWELAGLVEVGYGCLTIKQIAGLEQLVARS